MASAIKTPWLFKLGAASMLTLVGLGARYGHRGRLDEDATSLFNKAQLYHLNNSTS